MSKPEEPLAYHDLLFADEPAGQIGHALELLSGLDKLQVEKISGTNCLRIGYSLREYSLEGLEIALKKAGFCFEENLLDKLSKKVIYYCEEVQYHNLNTPEHLTKSKTPAVFARLYEKYPHGDYDETPKELREYK